MNHKDEGERTLEGGPKFMENNYTIGALDCCEMILFVCSVA